MEDGVGHIFDHIEDLLDFPGDEDVLGMVPEPILLPPLPVCGADELLGGEGGKKADGEFGVEEEELNPCDELEIEQLEWMSKFLEDSDSFSLGLTAGGGGGGSSAEKSVGERCCFRTSSPVSVLEANTNGGGGVRSDSSTTSSSSSSSTAACYFIGGKKEEKAIPPLSPPEPPAVPVVPGRARSKRTRPATFSLHSLVVIPSLLPPADAVTAATSDPESFGESSSPAPPPPLKKKSKKKKPNPYADESDSPAPPPVRKCAHCEIQKTPQWRAGPMGPKTLCNACGVRYKSGRLFPEYRPAASPTFVPSVHSNSHKKVVEMRIKANQNGPAAAAAASTDGCDLLDYIRRRRD